MARLRLYDYPPSGNCLKARILLSHLGREYERVEIDIFAGDTLSDAFVAINPARLTPVLAVNDAYLPESNAILWYLAEDSPYLPAEPLGRAQVVRWLLFEQERVGAIASLRFRLQSGMLAAGDPRGDSLREASARALEHLEVCLSGSRFLVDGSYTIADIANYCYVHVAPEADVSLDNYPAVRAWLERVESQPGFVNDLVPLPEDARVGRGLSIYG